MKVTNNTSPELVSDIWDGAVDIAVITSDINSKEKTKENILTTFRDIVIAGKTYAEQLKEPVSLEELAAYPLIGFGKNTEIYQLYDHFFAERGIDFNISIETDTPEQTLAFVSGNMGIGCIPPLYFGLRHALDEGEVFQVELKEMLPERRVSLVINENRVNSMAAILEDYILRYRDKNREEHD